MQNWYGGLQLDERWLRSTAIHHRIGVTPMPVLTVVSHHIARHTMPVIGLAAGSLALVGILYLVSSRSGHPHGGIVAESKPAQAKAIPSPAASPEFGTL